MEPHEVEEHSPAILQLDRPDMSLPRLSPEGGCGGGDDERPPSPPHHIDSDFDVDSDSHLDNWELLTRSQCGSNCGSSPRACASEAPEVPQEALVSVSGELAIHDEEDEGVARRRSRQAALLMLLPPPPVPVPTPPAVPAAAPATPNATGATPPSDNGSPRSAASGLEDEQHDVYSLTQDGSADDLSETYTDDLMTQAEPDVPPSPATGAVALREPPAGQLLGCCGLQWRSIKGSMGLQNLAMMTEQARALVAHAKPSARAAAELVWRSVAQWVGALHARITMLRADVPQRLAGLRAALPALPAQLAGLRTSLPPRLAAAAEGAGVAACALGARAAQALAAARKQLAQGKWDWAHVALAASCLSITALLVRSWQSNAWLAARLAEREEQLAELLIRIIKLKGNITNRTIPIVRYTSAATCNMAAHAAASCASQHLPAYPTAVTAV